MDRSLEQQPYCCAGQTKMKKSIMDTLLVALGSFVLGLIVAFAYVSNKGGAVAPVPTPAPLVVPTEPSKQLTVKGNLVITDTLGTPRLIFSCIPDPVIDVVDKNGKTQRVDLLRLLERLR